MALPESKCTLWTKQNDAGTVITPEIGPVGTIGGAVTYAPCKFDDGTYTNANTEYIQYPVATVFPNLNRFIIEGYIKTDFNVTNGRGDGALFNVLWSTNKAGQHGFYLGYWNDATNWTVVYIASALGILQKSINIGTWVAGTVLPVMVVVDNTASYDGLKTISYFINGIEVASFTDNFNMTTVDPLRIGLYVSSLNFPFNGVSDNTKVYEDPSMDLINAVILNSVTNSNEGWPSVPVLPTYPLTCVKVKPQVFILSEDIDIYDRGYVNEIIDVEEQKTFQRDKLIVNSITQEVKNYDNFFSVGHPNSVFLNTRWLYSIFKIVNQDRETIWDGIVRQIMRNHDNEKMAMIESTDLLSKFLNRKIEYESSDWETPATAFKNMCDGIGFTGYDPTSVQASENQLDNVECYIKCYFGLDDDITVQQVMEKLGEVGCADVYTHANKVYYVHYQKFTGGVTVNLVENDLLVMPTISYLIDDMINDYRIGYDGDNGIPAIDSANNDLGSISRANYGTQSLREMDCSAGNEIVFKDLTSAVYIGDCYTRRTHKNIDNKNKIPYPLMQMQYEISNSNKNLINLLSYNSMTLSDEAWTQKKWETFGTVNNSDENRLEVTANEVDDE